LRYVTYYGGGTVNYPDVATDLPGLPFKFEDKVVAELGFVNTLTVPCVSYANGKIFCSVPLLYVTPNQYFLRAAGVGESIYNSTAFEYSNFSASLKRSVSIPSKLPGFYGYRDFNESDYSYYGLYWEFDVKTKKVSSRTIRLTGQTVTESIFQRYDASISFSAAAKFLNSLNPSDPHRRLWENYKSAYSGLSETTLYLNWTSDPRYSIRYWPPSLTYNPTTGVALVSIQAGTAAVCLTYKKQLPANATYVQIIDALPRGVLARLLNSANLESAGWSLYKQSSTLQSVPTHFFAVEQ